MGLFDNIKKSMKTLVSKSYYEVYKIATSDLEREQINQELQNEIVKVEKEKEVATKKLDDISNKLASLKQQRESIDNIHLEKEEVIEAEIVEQPEVIIEEEVIEEKKNDE